VNKLEVRPDSDYSGKVAPELLEQLRSQLLATDEADRYRLFAALLAGLADQQQSRNNGRDAAEQAVAVQRRLQVATEEVALLKDEIATLKADLAHGAKQLADEQVRNQEFRKTIDSHRQRLEDSRKKEAELEAELVAKNTALHRVETDAERYQLQAQRASAASQDLTRVDALESEKRSLTAKVAELETQFANLRGDKDREIETWKEKLVSTKTQVDSGAEDLLNTVWVRLARAKPPLAEGGVKPNRQALERLFDSFVELAYFANNFENQMRPFLDRYTRHNEVVAGPWKAYRGREDVLESIVKTVAVVGGKHVGVLKMRLRELNKWTMGAITGGDVVVESIPSELEKQLRGPACMGANPAMTIRDFLRNDGHERFRDHMLEVRSHSIAEVHKITL